MFGKRGAKSKTASAIQKSEEMEGLLTRSVGGR